jgi:hypothetical protein
MNDLKLRAFVRQVIAEAKAKKDDKKADKKKEPKLPKSSGKLMDLKKEIAYLKEMSSQLQATGLNEVEQDTKVEFANLQKFVSELAKVKEAGADLKKKLDDEIKSIEEKIKAEKGKIKEMIGLAEPKTGMGEEKVEEARFKKGTDIGKKGKGFEKIEKAATKQYGSKEAGKKVAGAILKKVVAKEKK